MLPLTFTRPVSALRVGILTIAEKWNHHLKTEVSYKTKDYLQVKYPIKHAPETIWINGACLPDAELVDRVQQLRLGEQLVGSNNRLIASYSENLPDAADTGAINVDNATFVTYPEDIFRLNGVELEKDFDLVTAGRTSGELSNTNRVTGEGRIFLEPGAKVEGAILNPMGGVIYVGEGAEIMEGSLVRGSLGLCEHGALKLGAKVYGPTTVGPWSKIGGEVSNSVILGYSNKGHDGFLGNSVLGEWCNIGADSNNSNLKNNYAEVRLWDYVSGRFRKTGMQFCGLIMADHSKCGINTMFNTGTVVGVSSNLFGAGFPRNYVPSFAWGGSAGFSTYQLNKAFGTADVVMGRRNRALDNVEKDILTHVFELTTENRFWETDKKS